MCQGHNRHKTTADKARFCLAIKKELDKLHAKEERLPGSSLEPIKAVPGLPLLEGRWCKSCGLVTHSEKFKVHHSCRTRKENCLLQQLYVTAAQKKNGEFTFYRVTAAKTALLGDSTLERNGELLAKQALDDEEIYIENLRNTHQNARTLNPILKVLNWYRSIPSTDMTKCRNLAQLLQCSPGSLLDQIKPASVVYFEGCKTAIDSLSPEARRHLGRL